MMTQGPYAGYATQAEARNRCCIYSEINKTPSCCALDVSANHAEKDGLVFLRTIAMPSQKHSSPTVEWVGARTRLMGCGAHVAPSGRAGRCLDHIL